MTLTKSQARQLREHLSAIADLVFDAYESDDSWAPPVLAPPVLDPRFAAPPAIDHSLLDPRYAAPRAMADDGIDLDDHDTLRPEAPTPELQEAWEETKETIAKCFEIAHMAAGTDQAATDLRDAGGDTVCADVLQLLRRSGKKYTCGELCKALGTEDSKAVSRAAARLIDSGLASFEGERRAKRYFSIEAEHQAAE